MLKNNYPRLKQWIIVSICHICETYKMAPCKWLNYKSDPLLGILAPSCALPSSFELVPSVYHRGILVPSQWREPPAASPELAPPHPAEAISYISCISEDWCHLDHSTPDGFPSRLAEPSPDCLGPKMSLASRCFLKVILMILTTILSGLLFLVQRPLYPKMPWGLIMQVTLIL